MLCLRFSARSCRSLICASNLVGDSLRLRRRMLRALIKRLTWSPREASDLERFVGSSKNEVVDDELFSLLDSLAPKSFSSNMTLLVG